MQRDYSWTNKKLAHFWTAGGKQWWDTATCRGYHAGASRLKFYYKSDNQTCMTHTLHINEYGVTKGWVIIEKVKLKKK